MGREERLSIQNRITLNQVGKRFTGLHAGLPATEVLKDISFTLTAGEFVCLLGPSGCGKSTILNLIAGFAFADGGEVLLDGQPIHGPGPERGMVFQQPALIPQLNVRENLAIGWRLHYNQHRKLWWARTEPSELRQRLDEAIPLLELEPYLQRLPSELSGGQQQRVALGRCLIRRPAVFLLDEPLAHLDLAMARRIRSRLIECFTRWQSTVVWVTHDLEEAQAVADQVISLDKAEPATT